MYNFHSGTNFLRFHFFFAILINKNKAQKSQKAEKTKIPHGERGLLSQARLLRKIPRESFSVTHRGHNKKEADCSVGHRLPARQ